MDIIHGDPWIHWKRIHGSWIELILHESVRVLTDPRTRSRWYGARCTR